MLNRATPPPIHDAIEFDFSLPPISRHTLSNGVPLYWLRAGVQEVVEVDWVFPAGLWYEEKPAVASAVGSLMKSGTTARTAHGIAEAIEFYGATLKVSPGADFSTVTLYCLTRHLPQLLPIVQELLTDATFPEEELAIYKQNSIQRLLVNMRQCEFVANQRIDSLLHGEAHPYGRYTKAEKISALTREDLTSFYKKHYAPSNARIFMGGAVGEAEVALIEQIFGHAVAEKVAGDDMVFASPAPSENSHRVINDPNGVQGAIRIGRTFPNRHHPDFAPMVVLNTVFGGYFGSRLMSNIREEKGYTYGIYSSLQPMVHGGSLIIHTEAGRDVCEAAVKEIYKEMNLIREERIEEDELLLVKNYLLGGLLGDLDGPFQILGRWRTIILNGLNPEHFDRNVRIYKSVDAATLQELAQQYFKPEDYYEVVVI